MPCSICGQTGHYRVRCPHANTSARTGLSEAAASTAPASASASVAPASASATSATSARSTSSSMAASSKRKAPANRKAPNDADTEDDSARCSVCLQSPMRPPLYTTCLKNGHVVCATCYPKLQSAAPPARCPECREAMPQEACRNIALERAIAQHCPAIKCFNGCGYASLYFCTLVLSHLLRALMLRALMLRALMLRARQAKSGL